jgi:hypothetical protein
VIARITHFLMKAHREALRMLAAMLCDFLETFSIMNLLGHILLYSTSML